MNSRIISMIAMLAALSTALNYAMLPLPNVKLMDLIVFVAGFCLGPFAGALVGVLSWSIYGSLNPLGFSLPIWIALMICESIYGVAGGIVRRGFIVHNGGFKEGRLSTYVFFGQLGLLLTLAYDILTNVVFGLVTNLSPVVAVVVGFVPLGIIHVASNTFFFGVGCVPAAKAVLNLVGGENTVLLEE